MSATPNQLPIATTLYERVLAIAQETGPVRLSVTEPSHGALCGDISELVQQAAAQRYPLQTYEKVPAVREGGRTILARLYPMFIFEEFADAIIRDFIAQHRPFLPDGSVRYERPIRKADKQRRFEERCRQKYGPPTETTTSLATPSGGVVKVVTRRRADAPAVAVN